MSGSEKTREGFYRGEDGEWVPEGWEIIPISEANFIKIGDGNYSSKYPKASEFIDAGVPFISNKDMRSGRVVHNELRYISSDLHATLTKGHLKEGDVLVSTRANIGDVAFVTKHEHGANINAQLVFLRSDNENCVGRFLFYLLRQPSSKSALESLSSGSAQSQLPIRLLGNYKLKLPQLAEQKAIAAVLGSLDDKIELLREQNETLEALAQTLFKRWFIDFNFPRQNGNPYKDSGGKMVASEFGEIPEGWKIGEISIYAEHVKNSVSPNKSPDVVFCHYSIPSFDDGMKPVHESGSEIKSNKYEVVASSLLVSKLNPITPRVWPIQDVSKNSVCSTEFQVVKPQAEYYGFVYGALMSSPVRRELAGRAHGTSSSHQRVSPSDIFDVPFPVSGDGNLETTFSETISGILRKSDQNRAQVQSLTQFRDTLLPKLMKGGIRIPFES